MYEGDSENDGEGDRRPPGRAQRWKCRLFVLLCGFQHRLTRASSTAPRTSSTRATLNTPMRWSPDNVVLTATSNGARKLEARPTIT